MAYGPRRGAARCLNILGLVAAGQAHFELSQTLLEECLTLSREVSHRWGTGWALLNLALVLLFVAELGQTDARAADAVLEESEAIWNERGERRHLAFTYRYQAHAAILQGQLGKARLLLDQSLAMHVDMEDPGAMENLPWSWSSLLAAQGRFEPAVRMLGFRFGGTTGSSRLRPTAQVFVSRRLEAAREVLGAETVDAARRCHWTRSSRTADRCWARTPPALRLAPAAKTRSSH